jgi:hypothetical protein
MRTDWNALRKRVGESGGSARRRGFFTALAGRGEDADAAGREAIARLCRLRVESFLASAEGRAATGETWNPSGPGSPLENLGERLFRKARLRAEAVLARHGRRLTPAERENYRAGIDAANARDLTSVRRRLQGRLLRALAFRAGAAAPESWTDGVGEPGASGPYNDRMLVSEILRRASGADADWVRELSELYGRMDGLRRKCREFLPA